MRLMYYVADYWPRFSGHALHLRRRLPRLRSHGIEPWVLTRWYPGLSRLELVDGVRVVRAGRRGGSQIAHALREAALVAAMVRYRGAYDVAVLGSVHLAGILGGAAIERLARRPVVRELSLVGSDDPATVRAASRGLAALYGQASAFVPASPALESTCMKAGWQERTRLIPFGVDADEFRPPTCAEEKHSLRSMLGLPPEATIWVSVGSVIPRKGTRLLVEAFCRVCARRDDVRLVIAGPQPDAVYLDSVVQVIKSGGVGERISLRGRVEQIPELLRAADGFVLTSENEGLPNVLLEALATGLPVAATDIPGIVSAVLTQGVDGVIARPGDVNGLAEAVASMCEEPARRAALGVRGRELILAKYSLDREVAAHAALYREMAQGARSLE